MSGSIQHPSENIMLPSEDVQRFVVFLSSLFFFWSYSNIRQGIIFPCSLSPFNFSHRQTCLGWSSLPFSPEPEEQGAHISAVVFGSSFPLKTFVSALSYPHSTLHSNSEPDVPARCYLCCDCQTSHRRFSYQAIQTSQLIAIEPDTILLHSYSLFLSFSQWIY